MALSGVPLPLGGISPISRPTPSFMESLADALLDIYGAIGLRNFAVRQVVFFAASFALLYYIKPASMFRADGSLRPFKAISGDRDATWAWYPIVAFLLAYALTIFP